MKDEINKILDYITNLQQENERLKEEKDNLYLDNTMLKAEKDIYKQGYEDFKNLLNTLKNGSEENNTNNVDDVYKAFGLKD